MDKSLYSSSIADCTTVVDVYDSAAVIGKDFEYLIEQYGVEAVTDLMPKVIRVLEQLEYLAAEKEKENEEILQLQSVIRRLNNEKEERLKERQKYEQELEQVEESWRKESKELMQMISNLKDQNRRLQDRLSERSIGQEADLEKQEEACEAIESLKETVGLQRNQIKALEQDIKQKQTDMDAIQQQCECLTRDNESLLVTASHSQTQADKLAAHTATQMSLHSYEDTKKNIRTMVTQQEKQHSHANKHMQMQVNQLTSSLRDVKVLTYIKTMQAKHLIDEKTELQSLVQDRDQMIRKMAGEKAEADSSQCEDRVNLIGRMVSDVKDSDTPRFTLNELKEVLMERNTLKSRLIELEEELLYYKNKDKLPEVDTSGSWNSEQKLGDGDDDAIGEVQGPINREPWEKLHGEGRKQESGIRKFFKLLGLANEPKLGTRSGKSTAK